MTCLAYVLAYYMHMYDHICMLIVQQGQYHNQNFQRSKIVVTAGCSRTVHNGKYTVKKTTFITNDMQASKLILSKQAS